MPASLLPSYLAFLSIIRISIHKLLCGSGEIGLNGRILTVQICLCIIRILSIVLLFLYDGLKALVVAELIQKGRGSV